MAVRNELILGNFGERGGESSLRKGGVTTHLEHNPSRTGMM